MRQVLQSLRTGTIDVVNAPAPALLPRHVLVETRRTLISAGTERMLLEFGRGNIIEKALQQPDKVRQTLEKARTDGFSATLTAVRSKLDHPVPLGYCNAGIVRAVGAEIEDVRVGDRVASNGHHAELVIVGRNLVARIPDNVSDEAAAFTPLAAIALQGARLAKPMLGETFCVIGLGLVGLLAVQLLRAHGCHVIGVDFSHDRLALAKAWGADTVDADGDVVASALSATAGNGVDGVLIAAATNSDNPISQAAQISRKRGRIVLVGVAGLKLSRAEFYEKELSLQVSCSYGPGRYDPNYEERGEDYPLGFVRWTEQRNFEAVLREMASGRLDVSPLISATFDIGQANLAYDRLAQTDSRDLGLILTYPEARSDKFLPIVSLPTPPSRPRESPGKGVVAMIGAGNFAGRVLAPSLKAAGATLRLIVSQGGVNAAVEGRKAGFQLASSDVEAAFEDPSIDTIVIGTRHDSHASLVRRAINAGKHVFVEKPLALSESEIDAIDAALREAADKGLGPLLMVGFNRRFSPFATKMKALLESVREPKCLVAIVNAGSLSATHWTQDPVRGGGRIVGEACHFIDLMRFFVGSPIVAVTTMHVGKPTGDGVSGDKATITLSFEDGSIATVHYFANGPKALVKERIEAFAGGKFLRLDNFRRLEAIGWPRGATLAGRQDKGHEATLAAFMKAIRTGSPSPIPISEVLEVGRWSIRAASQRINGVALN